MSQGRVPGEASWLRPDAEQAQALYAELKQYKVALQSAIQALDYFDGPDSDDAGQGLIQECWDNLPDGV